MSNLNIEACRQPWESDERWALKKEFLKTFQHRFDEDRLLCLAETYVNVQRLHCSYPAPLMAQIQELAKELNHKTAFRQMSRAQQNIIFVKEGGDKPVKRDVSQDSAVHPHVKKVKLQNGNTISKNSHVNSNQLAVSNINNQLHMSEDNNLSVCTNQTPVPIIDTMKLETTNNSSHLDKEFSIDIIAEKLKNIKIIASHIRPNVLQQKEACWDILRKVCMKLGFLLSCNIVRVSNIKSAITIQVLDVILAKAKGCTKRALQNKVAKKALIILLSAFKIVSDGDNLVLKKDKVLTATSNKDKQLGISKNSNDPDKHTNWSPVPIIETAKLETDNYFQSDQPFSPDICVEKLEKIKKIASQIRPTTKHKKWLCWQLLHEVCVKSDTSLSCNITSAQNPEFVVTLKVCDVILSKVTHSGKKRLKNEASKQAVEILRHSAFKIVSDEENLLLKKDEEQTVTSNTSDQPVVSESNNDPCIHNNQAPTPIIETKKLKTADNSSPLNEPFSVDIYAEKLEEIKEIASQICPSKQIKHKKLTYWNLLRNACMKSGYSLSCKITTVKKPLFTITLKIFDVILSKVTHPNKNVLKAKAANMAVQMLRHSALKVVSDGENLILKKGGEKTVVTYTNEKLCMLKGDSDPCVSTIQSPKPGIKSVEVKTNDVSFELDESSSTNTIIADKLNKLKMIAPQIRPEVLFGKGTEMKCFCALQRVCQKLRYPFSCVIVQKPNSQFTATFKVLDVILSQVTDSTKKVLKSKAAKRALENLLYYTFKIVYSGENLILKVDEEQQVTTSNTHTEPSMLKDDNDPDISTTAKAETNNSSSQLGKSPSSDVFADKLNKIKMITPQIHPHMLHEGEWKYWGALQLACAKLNYSVSCDIIKEQNSQFTISLKVLDVILSKVTDSTKKLLKAKVGQKAFELLLHSAVKIVPDGENLVLKVDEQQTVKLSDSQIEQPDLKPLLPLMPNGDPLLLTAQNGQTKSFPLDPSVQDYFYILESSVPSSPVWVLVDSAEFCGTPLRFNLKVDCGPPILYTYELFLKDHKICSASAPLKTDAKDFVCQATLDRLSKVVYTIKVNTTNSDESVVLRHQVFDCLGSPPSLTETNIGCKLLKKMGWSGGGIGKEGNTGIVEPIKVWTSQLRGQGLGYSDKRKNPKANKAHTEFLHAKIGSFLLSYKDSNTINDLVFAADFSTEEKKCIHTLAPKYNLKSVMRGCGKVKDVSVERRLSLQELLGYLKKAGGSIGKYTLISPQQYVEGCSEDTSV